MIFLIFWTKPLPALPFCSLANSTGHAFAPLAFQGAGFRLHCLAATACGGPSNPAYVAKKNPSLDFFWIAELLRNSACAKSPSMALYWWQVRAKKIPPWIFSG
ncbi:MAG: hypothetical protein II631_04690, partial [Treponema sp.]|nr:hypothetical protein [Treponema sp.]